jgi:hypothetical protein
LVACAEKVNSENITILDLLSAEEVAEVDARLSRWDQEFRDIYRLRQRDYVIAGAAGALAGLADIFLVAIPARAGLLNGAPVAGGWLSNAVKGSLARLLPPDAIRWLEDNFPVPYDPSTNVGLASHVQGLGPRTHRMQSLGHDPILGWFFGVRDILDGTFTAIGSDGAWVRQPVIEAPDAAGANFVVRVVEAFAAVGGHLLSDVATPAGLPPPLFALLQMIQCGNIGGRTVAELARAMYASGYDFRHYLAGGVGVALIECIVRFAWMAGELSAGRPLQSSLLLAHSVAAGVNAGKVAITNNPLSVNAAQWMALARYMIPQLHWTMVGKSKARSLLVEQKIEEDFCELRWQVDKAWEMGFAEVEIPAL